jgi:hypothetical protein
MCSSFFRLPIMPTFDKFLEWGYIDGSIRFFMADSKKVGKLLPEIPGGLTHPS